jgi:hypothetical protein
MGSPVEDVAAPRVAPRVRCLSCGGCSIGSSVLTLQAVRSHTHTHTSTHTHSLSLSHTRRPRGRVDKDVLMKHTAVT